MHFQYKNGFTVVEILVILVFITIGIMSIYSVISSAINFTTTTRQRIIGINIAREGMESVYNIRDTNWQRWSGKKDECWLKIDPMVDSGNDGCENDIWIQSRNYRITEKDLSGQKYSALEVVNSNLNIKNGTGHLFKMCQNNNFWYNCTGTISTQITSSASTFYRGIIGKGLKYKDDNSNLVCSSGNIPIQCGNSRAKEFAFCSRVEYIGNGYGNVEFCSSITNFLE